MKRESDPLDMTLKLSLTLGTTAIRGANFISTRYITQGETRIVTQKQLWI